ncbi:MAG: hypothetical protein JWR04_1769 [Rhodoglobus sp.]|nr:hypothetical protein [Rhodoglobus sp.]
MTTFHEPQPQSRRAVRQSERADGSEAQDIGQDSGQQFSAPAGDMWDTTSRRAAQLPPVSSLSEEATPGRRSATPPTALPEPLHYSTQTKSAAPAHDGPTFRSRGTSAPQPVPFDTSAQPAYRVRDFSPEGRNGSADSTWGEPNPAPTAAVSPASDLDYHTEARFRAAAAAAPLAPISEVPASVAPINKMWAAPAPAAVPEPEAAASGPDYSLEQTFTRRELRAMQQAEEAAALQSQQPAAPAPVAQQPVVQQPAAQPAVQAPFQTQQPAAPFQTQQPAAFPLVEPRVGPPPAMPPASAPPALPPVSQPPVSQAPAASSPTFVPSAPAAAPVSASPFDSLFTAPAAPAKPDPVAEVPAEIIPAPVDEPSPWTPPTGHWSTQLTADDDDDVETTISRRIGSGSTATSALVLPTIPNGTDIRGPLTSTGEIMLTGSIDLPRNLAATGQSDRFDRGSIDELFDLNDAEVISTDSSPVRAIRAVSTHTSGHGVTHTQKPKGTRALTALLIAASSMAVVVAGLLVAAFAFNVF